MTHKNQSWKKEFEERGIEVRSTLYAEDVKDTWLCITNCSRKKKKDTSKPVTPKELYTGAIFSHFVRFCERHHLSYGILSDLYGLCFETERIMSYDLAPSDVKNRDALGRLILTKLNKKYPQKNTIVYYRTSPIFAQTYLDILLRTGLQIIYVLKLRNKKPDPGFNLLKG